MKDNNIEIHDRVCIIKIVSGPLSGNELMLTVDAHRIVIGPELDYRTDIDDSGKTTYFIPSEHGNYELAIVSKDNVPNHDNNDGSRLFVILMGEQQHTTLPVTFQELMLVEQFPIIIKMPNDPWLEPAVLPQSSSAKGSNVNGSSLHPRSNKKTYSYLIGMILIATVIISAWCIADYKSTAGSRKMETLKTILQGSISPLAVTTGENGQSLILVKTQRDRDWSSQRLLREQYPEPVSIKKISDLELEIENELIELLPGLLKVDLSNPCQPIIRTLGVQLPQPDKQRISQFIMRFINCNAHNQIVTYSIDELLKKAEQGLIESNVPWRLVNKNNRAVFIIDAKLNDKQALSVIRFSEDFARRWGTKHIQFSISLATEYLAGKSFTNHPNGYILLDNNHWYFKPVTL